MLVAYGRGTVLDVPVMKYRSTLSVCALTWAPVKRVCVRCIPLSCLECGRHDQVMCHFQELCR